MKSKALVFLFSALAAATCLCAAAPAPDSPSILPMGANPQPALDPAPFPDRLSAYVWRNWGLVPTEDLAAVVGATREELAAVASEMGLRDVRPDPDLWRKRGPITLIRRNWHLLPYDQLLALLKKTPDELYFSLMEDDFLWVKLGRTKPLCDRLVYDKTQAARSAAARRRLAAWLAEEGVDPNAPEEPRFAFIEELARVTPAANHEPRITNHADSPFDFRLIFSYFADFADPLADPEIRSFPEGLLQKLSAQGVNAVWMHTVLRTLAKDPKYPEFGAGSEKRMANLRKLVARAAKYGIKVYLYMNEPRAMPPAFFEKSDERRAMRGARQGDQYALCTAHPETLRWAGDALEQVFANAPGLGGIFTITMSENLTHCASRWTQKTCPHCAGRRVGDLIVETNRALIEGMQRGNPNAEAILYSWAWPKSEEEYVIARLPKKNVRVMSVSEHGVKTHRGGVEVAENDYAISVLGPGEEALRTWGFARANGMSAVAKVQAGCSWELSSFPYLPTMDLVAQHAVNLAEAGVHGVMLSWSLGCCPSPNLAVYRDLRKGETTIDGVLDRLAAETYGAANVKQVRRAWKAFSDGFANYPFSIGVLYNGVQQWGPANPLYVRKTGWRATMVGIPYDAASMWAAEYPIPVYVDLMDKVAKGFDEGCRLIAGAVPKRESDLFRAEQMHFASCRDQAAFVAARDAGDRAAARRLAAVELARAKAYLPLVRADGRIGYESSNQYFFVPRDVVEKILSCRLALETFAVPRARNATLQTAGGPLVQAHRGARCEYDDNAAGGFAWSLKKGLRGFETDVRFSKDHRLVILHDDTLARTTDGAGAPEARTFAELRQLRLKNSSESVPAAEEVMDALQKRDDVFIELEMKARPSAFYTPSVLTNYCRALKDAAARHLAPGTYCFTCGETNVLKTMRAVAPEAPLGFILGKKLDDAGLALARDLGCCSVAPLLATTKDMVDKAHAAGLTVCLWMVQDAAAWAEAKQKGADRVTSDYPHLLDCAVRGKRKRVVALDLDATLCQHRSPVPPANFAALDELRRQYLCVMSGAGNAPRIHKQMGGYPLDVIGNYGMQIAEGANGDFRIVRQITNVVDRAFFRRETDRLRKKYGYEKYEGEPLEFHASGMVTFGLLGTTPAAEHKVAFDPDRRKRRAMYAEVCQIFKDHSVYIGGSTSFDFAGPEYNKYDSTLAWARERGFDLDDVVFIGDDFADGGGDSHVRIKGMDHIVITDYRDFPKAIRVLLERPLDTSHEPRATNHSPRRFDVAAFVWPAYQPEPRWAELGIFKDGRGEWQNVYEAEKRFPDDYQGVKPIWGYENEADPAVVARKIDAATAAGVNVFIYDWYWYGGRPFLENALDEGFLKAGNCERMKFYVMWANHDVTHLWNRHVGGKEKEKVIWPAKVSDADYKAIVARWISKYFTRPNYYKIDGKPVLMIYDVGAFARWDGVAKARERLAYLKAEAQKHGFPGVHLQRLDDSYDPNARDPLGFDSTTHYNWLALTGGWYWDAAHPAPDYAHWGEIAVKGFDGAKRGSAKTGALYFPNLTVGWDTNSRYPAADARPFVRGANPRDFERFARAARDWAEKNLPPGVPRLITVNSWNEWTEGSYLEPDDKFGYGYLNALNRVFVQGR